MKANINGIEFEGTPEEFKELLEKSSNGIKRKRKTGNPCAGQTIIFWTDKEVQKLKELKKSNMSLPAIAKEMKKMHSLQYISL